MINFFNIHVIKSSEAVSECRYDLKLCKLRTTLEPFLNYVLKNHGWEKARTVFLYMGFVMVSICCFGS